MRNPKQNGDAETTTRCKISSFNKWLRREGLFSIPWTSGRIVRCQEAQSLRVPDDATACSLRSFEAWPDALRAPPVLDPSAPLWAPKPRFYRRFAYSNDRLIKRFVKKVLHLNIHTPNAVIRASAWYGGVLSPEWRVIHVLPEVRSNGWGMQIRDMRCKKSL